MALELCIDRGDSGCCADVADRLAGRRDKDHRDPALPPHLCNRTETV